MDLTINKNETNDNGTECTTSNANESNITNTVNIFGSIMGY